MSGALDSRATATALRMLRKFGKVCTYTHTVNGTYDPASGTAPVVSTSYTVTVLLAGIKMRNTNLAKVRSSEPANIRNTMLSAMIAALELPIVPTQNDTLTVDGLQYTVMDNPLPTYSGEKIALWSLKAMR